MNRRAGYAVAKDPPGSEGSVLTNKVYANATYFCVSRDLSLLQDSSKDTTLVSLGMVWANSKIGEQQLLPAWVLASAVWFNRYENGINVFERLRIVSF